MFFLEVGYKIKKKRRGGMSMRKKMKLFIAMVSVEMCIRDRYLLEAGQSYWAIFWNNRTVWGNIPLLRIFLPMPKDMTDCFRSVSYTHLDVYKRQRHNHTQKPRKRVPGGHHSVVKSFLSHAEAIKSALSFTEFRISVALTCEGFVLSNPSVNL